MAFFFTLVSRLFESKTKSRIGDISFKIYGWIYKREKNKKHYNLSREDLITNNFVFLFLLTAVKK